MEYRWDSTAGCLVRFDAKKNIFEGFNWKTGKWQRSNNAYDAYVGIYDGFLDKITEQDVNDIIKRDLKK